VPGARDDLGGLFDDGHAPAGVMAEFLILNRDLYVGVRYYHENFTGTSRGTEPISFDDVLEDFTVAPLSFDKQTAEVDLRLGLFSFVTLQASMPISQAERLSATDAVFFETSSKTYGDVSVRGLFDVLELGEYRMNLNLGATIPTGRINKQDATPFAASETLPYAMQGGSGTPDVLAALTFLVQNEVASVGAQINTVTRVVDNRRGYRLGNEYSYSVWGAHNLTDWVSVSMRGLYETWGDVTGSDPGTDGAIDPGANSFFQGGERVQIPFGVNLFLRDGPFNGHRLLLEWYYLVHQDLNGPQLSAERTLVVSWQTFF
jgi:hypothetical protein